MLGSLLTTIASLALLALAFVPLEKAFPARPGQAVLRRGAGVDLCFFLGQHLVWGGAALSVLVAVRAALEAALPAAFRAWATALPIWQQAFLAIVLGDVLVYWFHRACHTFEPLWRFHAVHHSAEHLDFLAAHREHPLDGICTQLCVNLPAFVLCFRIEHVAALMALRGMWAIFIHSNVRLPLGPLRLLLGAPELHHWHHARVERTRHNFSNLAPWVDLVFGTYHRPQGAETYAIGVDGPWPRGYLAQLVEPFRLFLRRGRKPPGSPGPNDGEGSDRCSNAPSPSWPF